MDQEEECLLCHHKFVAKSENARRELQKPDWEASTLPLSYTRFRALAILVHDRVAVKRKKKGGAACPHPPKVNILAESS